MQPIPEDFSIQVKKIKHEKIRIIFTARKEDDPR
jgi:hypothetical protein